MKEKREQNKTARNKIREGARGSRAKQSKEERGIEGEELWERSCERGKYKYRRSQNKTKQ